jgi:uncharacterized protein YneF (UPF0154 family)
MIDLKGFFVVHRKQTLRNAIIGNKKKQRMRKQCGRKLSQPKVHMILIEC